MYVLHTRVLANSRTDTLWQFVSPEDLLKKLQSFLNVADIGMSFLVMLCLLAGTAGAVVS